MVSPAEATTRRWSALQKQQHAGGQPCRNNNMTVVSPAEATTRRWSALQKQQHTGGQPCRNNNTTVVSPAETTTQHGGQPGTCNICLLGNTSSPATRTSLSKQTAGKRTGKTIVRLHGASLKTARSASICWTPVQCLLEYSEECKNVVTLHGAYLRTVRRARMC